MYEYHVMVVVLGLKIWNRTFLSNGQSRVRVNADSLLTKFDLFSATISIAALIELIIQHHQLIIMHNSNFLHFKVQTNFSTKQIEKLIKFLQQYSIEGMFFSFIIINIPSTTYIKFSITSNLKIKNIYL